MKSQKRYFTNDEDKIIKETIEKEGIIAIPRIAEQLKRTRRSVKERWVNYLNTSRQKLTNDELTLLIEKVKEYGTKWSYIKIFFPGKSGNYLRDVYNSIGSKSFKKKYPDFEKSEQSIHDIQHYNLFESFVEE